MNEIPRLVDYSLFVKPKPKIVKKLPEISNSVLINIIIIIILLIGSVILYQRSTENEITADAGFIMNEARMNVLVNDRIFGKIKFFSGCCRCRCECSEPHIFLYF